MVDEWFRPVRWDEPTRSEFERRLARARPSGRQQYLRIAGVHLREAGELDAARELWLRALGVPAPIPSESAAVLEHLGDLAVATGDPESGAALYRRALAEQPDGNGTSGAVELSLAEVLVVGGGWDGAAHLLGAWHGGRSTALDHELFRAAVLQARLAEHHGDRGALRGAAARALSLLGRGPVFPRHPTVGLARTDAETTAWLRRSAHS